MILSIDGKEYNLDVDYISHPAEFGKRVGGLQMEPDYPAYIEITSIKIETEKDVWQDIILPDKVLDDIERELLNE